MLLHKPLKISFFLCGPSRARTYDPLIMSQVLLTN